MLVKLSILIIMDIRLEEKESRDDSMKGFIVGSILSVFIISTLEFFGYKDKIVSIIISFMCFVIADKYFRK